MPTTILFRRGNINNLPTLSPGEPAFLMDTGLLAIGSNNGNVILGREALLATSLPDKTVGYSLNGHSVRDTSIKTFLDFRVMINSTTPPLGEGSISCGRYGGAFGKDCFSTGYNCTANGSNVFVAGKNVTLAGFGSVAMGDNIFGENVNYTTATGANHIINNIHHSFISGSGNTSTGYFNTVNNRSNIGDTFAVNVFGQFNKSPGGPSDKFSSLNSAIVVGNGTSDSSRTNCFRVKYDGSVYGLSSFNSSGADYAEFFEWEDGNVNDEDRIGRFVTISKGDTIGLSTAKSKEVLGIVSASGAIIGNCHSEAWVDMYEKDSFGRIIYETTMSEDNMPIKTPKINPNYDSSLDYISREDRKEWDPIGLMGRLKVIDNGSCTVGDYCTYGNKGVAIPSAEGYRVLKRVSSTVIEILFK